MPRIDNLFQFIVPLTFLAIWALTSLFNREAQPLPPRNSRPQPPGGPGPGPGGGLTLTRPESMGRDPSVRWTSPTTNERTPPRRPAGRSDDILIIEEARRPPASSPASTGLRPVAGGGSRRGGRPRPAPAAAPRRPEPSSPRPLSGALGPTLTIPQSMSRPLELNPLTLPTSPLLGSEQRTLNKTVSEPTRQASRPAPTWDDFRLLLNSPAKLREAIIVSEILQPPLSLRQRRTGP